jgi:hypothetical protein
MRSLLLATALFSSAATVPALEGRTVPPPSQSAVHAGHEGREGDPEIASMRRTLVSALVVKKLALSAEQKTKLVSLIQQAKQLEEDAKNERDSSGVKDQRKALLQKAIDEARSSGKLDDQTKNGFAELGGKAQDGAQGFRTQGRELMKQIRAVFTDDQLASLQDLRSEIPGARMRGGREGKGNGKRGGAMLFRLMMTDEFAAELSR